jgi:DNA-binding MarR family transcriptional regulator
VSLQATRARPRNGRHTVSPRRTAAQRAPHTGEAYPPSESIGLLLRIALFGLRSSFKASLARCGVPWSSWYYLRVLWESDGISQRELTERVGVMQPNTVSALRSMDRAGLVWIEPQPLDRRSTRVWLTPKARDLMRRLLPEIRAAARPVALKGFTQAEEAELRRLLNKICDNVRPNAPK